MLKTPAFELRTLVKVVLLFYGIVVFSFPVAGAAPSLTGSGTGWTQAISSANLISGAGSDLTNTYQSATNATTLNVNASASYTMKVYRTDSLWDTSNLVIYVKRTANGTGAGSISGGTAFQAVTTTSATFFTGTKNRTGVTVQYQVSGVSVLVSPNNYSTVVTFAVQ